MKKKNIYINICCIKLKKKTNTSKNIYKRGYRARDFGIYIEPLIHNILTSPYFHTTILATWSSFFPCSHTTTQIPLAKLYVYINLPYSLTSPSLPTHPSIGTLMYIYINTHITFPCPRYRARPTASRTRRGFTRAYTTLQRAIRLLYIYV